MRRHYHHPNWVSVDKKPIDIVRDDVVKLEGKMAKVELQVEEIKKTLQQLVKEREKIKVEPASTGWFW